MVITDQLTVVHPCYTNPIAWWCYFAVLVKPSSVHCTIVFYEHFTKAEMRMTNQYGSKRISWVICSIRSAFIPSVELQNGQYTNCQITKLLVFWCHLVYTIYVVCLYNCLTIRCTKKGINISVTKKKIRKL